MSWTQYMGHTVVDLPWSSGQGSGGLGAVGAGLVPVPPVLYVPA